MPLVTITVTCKSNTYNVSIDDAPWCNQNTPIATHVLATGNRHLVWSMSSDAGATMTVTMTENNATTTLVDAEPVDPNALVTSDDLLFPV